MEILIGFVALFFGAILGHSVSPHRRQRAEEEPKEVKCEECRHKIDSTDAQKGSVRHMDTFYQYPFTEPVWYCQMHKKPYGHVDKSGKSPRYFLLDQTIEVNEQGKPVKAPVNTSPTKKRGRPKGSKNKVRKTK